MKITKKFAPITIEIETAEELTELISSINDMMYTTMTNRFFIGKRHERESLLKDILERLTK